MTCVHFIKFAKAWIAIEFVVATTTTITTTTFPSPVVGPPLYKKSGLNPKSMIGWSPHTHTLYLLANGTGQSALTVLGA